MSDLGEALRTWALTKTPITELCGTRWHPDQMREGESLPAVVYEIISGEEEGSLGPTRVGISHVRMQIDAVAMNRIAANALAKAIRDELASFRGNMDDVFVTGVSVDGSLRTDTAEIEQGSDERYYLASRDYLISFND